MTYAIAPRIRVRARALLRLARHGRPPRVLLFGALSLGDDLLCTAVLREARNRGTPFAMMTARPELFQGNEDASTLLPVDDYYARLLRRLGSKVVQPYYARLAADGSDRDHLPNHHIIAEMCRLAGLAGSVTLRPYLQVSTTEERHGHRVPNQIAIQSTVANARVPFATKEWGVARLAQVARELGSGYWLVQLGAKDDPPLPVAVDLRGKTTLREAAAVLAASTVFIGLEGFLAHLARAVDCPGVIVHGGRTAVGITSYLANTNLFTRPACSPCGLRSGCQYDLACMQAITPAEVVNATRALIAAKLSRPLAAETAIV